jgi:hypothetical protein
MCVQACIIHLHLNDINMVLEKLNRWFSGNLLLINPEKTYFLQEEWCLLGCYTVWLLYIPEDTILHSHRHENRKSYTIFFAICN